MSIAKIVKRHLNNTGISIYALSKGTNIPQNTINQWISEKRKLPYNVVWAILDFLDLDTDDLMQHFSD